MEDDKMDTVKEVRLKPCQCKAGDAKEVRKAFKEDTVAKCDEGSKEAKEDEDAGFPGVCSEKEIIGDLDHSGLSAVARPVC